jgi:hypothetical protein
VIASFHATADKLCTLTYSLLANMSELTLTKSDLQTYFPGLCFTSDDYFLEQVCCVMNSVMIGKVLT